jgi:hypothetical protein
MKIPLAATLMPELWWPHLQQEARPRARGQTRKRSAMKRLNLVAALVSGALLAGCTRFQHQASEPEPHGLIHVAKYSSASRDHGVVTSINGKTVRAGREYRVVPGEHRVTVLFVESEMKTYNTFGFSLFGTAPAQPANESASAYGDVAASGTDGHSKWLQPATRTAEVLRTRYLDHTIAVQAGWHYDLDGDNVTRQPLGPL